ncbi:MAG: class I SAM-dependent methyltransferase [Janthinobacterium lividum]
MPFPQCEEFSVLDVGCGEGRVMRDYVLKYTHASHLVGLDPNQEMLNLAQKLLSEDDKVSFIKSSVEEFRSESGAFDCVTSFSTLH